MSRNTLKRRQQTTSYSEGDEDLETTHSSLSSAGSTAAKRSRKSASPDPDHDKESVDSDHTRYMYSNINLEAEVGIIEKITLINFMCHTMLEVSLGPNVNFIIGHNGSGKSAIVTAIVLGLGGKPIAESRHSYLKKFIKNKCRFAQIIIKLRNRGRDAYCPEAYGKSIIVERCISSDGGSGYKIKSVDGNTISTEEEELKCIVNHFGIQVDNPAVVLDQGNSRAFKLNSTDPQDLYKFFLMSTGLYQMSMDSQMLTEEQESIEEQQTFSLSDMKTLVQRLSDQYNDSTHEEKIPRALIPEKLGDYNRVLKDSEELNKVISLGMQALPNLKKLVQTDEEKYRDSTNLKTMKEQLEGLKRERVWTEVIQMEKELRPLEKAVEDAATNKAMYKEKLDETCNKIKQLELEWQSLQESMDLAAEEMTEVQEEHSEIAADLKTKKTTLRGKQSNLSKLREDLNSTKLDEQQLIDRIREIKQARTTHSGQRNLEAGRRQRQRELEAKREELEANRRELEAANNYIAQLERTISTEKEKSYRLRLKCSLIEQEITELEKYEKDKSHDLTTLFSHSTPRDDLNCTLEQFFQQLFSRMKEMRQTSMGDVNEQTRQRQSELQSKQADLEAYQRQLQTTTVCREVHEKAISSETNRLNELRTEISDAWRSIDQIQRELFNLRSSRSNRMRIFGSWVPELLNRIRQNRQQFHQLPVGPIGAHLSVRDQTWACSIEKCIGGLADAFCCNDSHDEQALKRIMLQVCPNNKIPQIIISKFQDRYDVSSGRPQCNFPTVLDELVIDNPVVANCLIDQAGIESIIVMRNARDAPIGVKMIFPVNLFKVAGEPISRTAKYLSEDIEQKIRQLEDDLQQRQEHHKQLLQQQRESETIINNNKRELQKSSSKALQEQEIVNHLIEEITELRSQEEDEFSELSKLKEEQAFYSRQVKELEKQVTDAESECEKAWEAVKNIKEIKEIVTKKRQNKIQEVMDKNVTLKDRQDVIIKDITTQKNCQKYYERKCKEANEVVKRAENKLRAMQKKIKDSSDVASWYCSRVETTRSAYSLQTEIIQKERRIRTAENRLGCHEGIARNYFEVKTNFEVLYEKFVEIQKAIEEQIDKYISNCY